MFKIHIEKNENPERIVLTQLSYKNNIKISKTFSQLMEFGQFGHKRYRKRNIFPVYVLFDHLSTLIFHAISENTFNIEFIF
jgi:hypothetical protein